MNQQYNLLTNGRRPGRPGDRSPTSSSVAVAQRSGTLLNEPVPSIRMTAELDQEVATASRERARGSGQVNKAMTEVDRVTQSNASSAEELTALPRKWHRKQKDCNS